MSSPLYTKALIIGATSGIGLSLASKLLSQGTKVIVVGRRQDRLDHFVSTHSSGSDKAVAVQLDITRLDEIPRFAASIAQEHPDLDCIVLNAGIQRSFDFSRPETVDLSILNEEITTNYTSQVHLTMALLPILQKQPRQTHLIYVGTMLGIVPFSLRTGNYNASKGALHNWILVLREQLKRGNNNNNNNTNNKDQNGNVKVIEIFPPAVQTELHDERHQPDLRDGGSIGMPLTEFTEAVYAGLLEGEEQIGVGHAKATLEGVERVRQEAFLRMIPVAEEMLRRHLK